MMKRFLASVLLAALALPALAQTVDGDFTISTSAADGMLTPTLTWDTNAAACTASGDAEWSGPKPASGTVTLSPRPTSQVRSFALLCSTPDDSAALLTWTPPTENTDGSPLTDLAGYRVYWGQQAEQLVTTVQLDNPGLTGHTVNNLSPGTWYFGVRAFTALGAESELSNIVSKTTTAGTEWSAQTGIKVPKAPTLQVEE